MRTLAVVAIALSWPLAVFGQAHTNTLNSGDKLLANQSIYSADGVYEMRMQSDCNLVIYRTEPVNAAGELPHPVPQAYTNTQPSATGQNNKGCYLWMQPDGNLVIYDDRAQSLWHSGTQGKFGALATLLGTKSYGHLVLSINGNIIWTCLSMPRPCSSTGDRK